MDAQAIVAPKEVSKKVFAMKAFVRLGKLGESGPNVLQHVLAERDLASEHASMEVGASWAATLRTRNLKLSLATLIPAHI